MVFNAETARQALRLSWSTSTARQWRSENPALGQCNVTALLMHELYGGDILKTPLPEGDHFYNRIDEVCVDLTSSQFASPIEYLDILSSREEAFAGATQAEYSALRAAYLRRAGAN